MFNIMYSIHVHRFSWNIHRLHGTYHFLQAYYRLGSCLFVQRKYREAMEKFSESLSLLLNDTSRSDHQVDTLSQLLAVALKLPGKQSIMSWFIILP